MDIINIKTTSHEELKDITSEVQNIVRQSEVQDGICLVYTVHTTAGITINENADSSVKGDILNGIKSLGLESQSYKHMEGNSPSHIKSSLFGCSESLIIENGRLILGTWQGIFFCEFDGPRSRKVYVKIIGE